MPPNNALRATPPVRRARVTPERGRLGDTMIRADEQSVTSFYADDMFDGGRCIPIAYNEAGATAPHGTRAP